MLSSQLAFGALGAAALLACGSAPPTVNLPQGQVAGNFKTSSSIEFPRPVAAYHSIPYAAPPVDNLRFAYPQPARKWSAVLNETTFGPVCPQPASPAISSWSEDCLTLDIFVPPGTTAASKLPVLLYIPGGLFTRGSGSQLDLAAMVAQSPKDFIAVSFNYRIGALGFLPSNLTRRANLLNLGWADQVAAIKWVNSNIHLFGGDASEVTLYGISAGAHSLGYHLLNTEIGSPALFKRAMLASGGATARAFPHYTNNRLGSQSDDFVAALDCARANDAPATFACLRKVPIETLRDVNNNFLEKAMWNLLTPFQPVVDDKFVKRPAHESLELGDFHKVDILTGSTLNEGTIWAPRNLSSDTDARDWLHAIIPKLRSTDLDNLFALYPSPYATNSPYTNSPFSPQWSRLAEIYGDYAYISSVQGNAVYWSDWEALGVKVFKYNLADLSGAANATYGVTHGSDGAYVTGTASNRVLSRQVLTYFASFITTGDPNTLSSDSQTYWPTYSTDRRQQLRFSDAASTVEQDDERAEAKAFWRGIPDLLDH